MYDLTFIILHLKLSFRECSAMINSFSVRYFENELYHRFKLIRSFPLFIRCVCSVTFSVYIFISIYSIFVFELFQCKQCFFINNPLW